MVLVLRVLMLILSALGMALMLVLPLSTGGMAVAAGQFVVASALLFPFEQWLIRGLCGLVGICLLAVPALERRDMPLVPKMGNFETFPARSGARWINTIISEEDGIYLGMKMLVLLQGITPREAKDLIPTLQSAYRALREKEGEFPTALIATMLGMQSPEEYDVLSFNAPSCQNGSDSTVIFLHGTGGNWGLLCYLVAEAARERGFNTVCPSSGAFGMWGSERGRRVFQNVLEVLKDRGSKHIVLAGLSAGGIGAAELAKEFSRNLEGLVLLFGSHPDVSFAHIPTLHVYGRKDERMPQRWLASFAEMQKKQFADVEVHALDDDHFSLLKNPHDTQTRIVAWLSRIHSEPTVCIVR